MPSEAPTGEVRSVRSALRIIRHLTSRSDPQGVNRIANELDLSVATCFRLVKTLASEGLLDFDEDTKEYSPSTGLIGLARGVIRASEAERLHATIEAISQKYRVTSMAIFPVGDSHAVVTDIVERDSALRLRVDIGEEFDLFVGAFGRCFAASWGLSDRQLKKRFASIEWEESISFSEYLAQVKQAAKNGYAIDEGIHLRGLCKVSAAIRQDGRPRSAISALAFPGQFKTSELRAIGKDLRVEADRLEEAFEELDRRSS